MTETRQRRRYTKHQKAVAVSAALASSTLAAAETQGIPESTLRQWVHDPAYADLREKTREVIAEEARVGAQLFLAEIIAKRATFEPRDLAITFGILIDKAQLLSGEATSRSEHRDLSTAFPDAEWDALTEFLREKVAADAGA